MTYAQAKFEVATSNSLREDAFIQENTLFDKVTHHVTKYPLHHGTYAPAKFAVATSNRLGGDAFTRKYIM